MSLASSRLASAHSMSSAASEAPEPAGAACAPPRRCPTPALAGDAAEDAARSTADRASNRAIAISMSRGRRACHPEIARPARDRESWRGGRASNRRQGTGDRRQETGDRALDGRLRAQKAVQTGYKGGRSDRAHGWHLLGHGAGGRLLSPVSCSRSPVSCSFHSCRTRRVLTHQSPGGAHIPPPPPRPTAAGRACVPRPPASRAAPAPCGPPPRLRRRAPAPGTPSTARRRSRRTTAPSHPAS
jgi:hypothetical protein